MPKGVPFEVLPKILQNAIGREQYNKMSAERTQWTEIIKQRKDIGPAAVYIDLPALLKRLSVDRQNVTPEEITMSNMIINSLTAINARHKHFIDDYNAHTSWEGWGPESQSYTLSSAVLPEYNMYYNTGGSHRKTRIGNWFSFRNRMSWSVNDYKFATKELVALKSAFSNRGNLEKGWEAERKSAAEAAAAAEAARQEELRQKAQAAAAKASYEDALRFKTEEFNRALAAQKEEHGRKSQDYEARLAQFSENFERQAKELSDVRLEIAKQKTDYENQLAARKLEESKRKQEAEVLQSNLKRRIAIYEAGRGANLHFVGVNGKDGQNRGARVFANSGGRYVKSRISYGPNRGFHYLNTGSENSNVPDLFLDVLSPSNRRRERR